ncbi:Uncharacterized protein FWK35_00013863 [Aphis craccivora]|uniref:Uncharacterized protein n=1 Tax=Aphis craccivora TaxID=307492 RepID=A0A6G0Z2M0_APHCR|nr:Uncharacterized protein FWK35_00013863 [Aphis craccivora]
MVINLIEDHIFKWVILDSERSDECIDFTMLCVFFLSEYTRTCRNNAPISNFRNGFRFHREKPKKKKK